VKADRRRFTRYIAQKDGFHVFSHDSKIIGRLKDISKGGLAYQYKPIKGEKMESNMIDIMAAGPHRIYLFDIACNTIYDDYDLEETQSFTGAERRRRGLQYVRLTEYQHNKLDLLLKSYDVQPSDNSD
jgi:hypothetical protein